MNQGRQSGQAQVTRQQQQQQQQVKGTNFTIVGCNASPGFVNKFL